MNRFWVGVMLAAAVGVATAGPRDEVILSYMSSLATQHYVDAAKAIRTSDLADYKQNFAILFRAEAKGGKREFLSAAFGPTAKVEDALNAPPDAMFAATMMAIIGAATKADMKPQFLPPKILGEVEEGAELIHVLARTSVKLGDITSSKIEVISMAPDGGAWKIVLPEQLKAMGQIMLKQNDRRQPQR